MRNSSLGFLRWLVPVVTAALVYQVTGYTRAPQQEREPARSFLPGPLGHEPGRLTGPSPRAFLTRFMSEIGSKPGERTWYEFNQLGPSINFMHNLEAIAPRSAYATEPELFPWVAGKRHQPVGSKLYWQPDLGSPLVADKAARLAKDHFRKQADLRASASFSTIGLQGAGLSPVPRHRQPGASSYALGINDALIFGESPELLRQVLPLRYFRTRPDYSNLVFGFMNRVAQKLDRDSAFRLQPSAFLGCLAYYWCEQVPDFPVHPQVIPFLCSDRSQGYDPVFWAEEMRLQEAWGRAGPKRLGLYDYVDGHGFWIPRLHTRLLAEHLRHAHRNGFTDYWGEAGPNWGLEGPQPWLIAQLLQDPEADPQALLDEYYRRYYAESAKPMRAFFELCEETWMSQKAPVDWLKLFRNEAQADLFPSSLCRRLRALLSEAETLAVQDKVRGRVRLNSEAFKATELFVSYVETKRSLYAATSTAAELLTYEQAKLNFLSHLEYLKREFPLALNDYSTRDFDWMEPVYEQVLRRFERGEAEPPLRSPGPCRALPALDARIHGKLGPNLIKDPSFDAPVRLGQRIASMPYEADVSAAWQSRVEPGEGVEAVAVAKAARSGPAGLLLSNHKACSVFQWASVSAKAKAYEADAWFKGQLCPSARVMLQLSWVDAQGRLMSGQYAVKVLPSLLKEPGEAGWHRLRVGLPVPEGAKWVGFGVVAVYMLSGDTLFVDDCALRAIE